MSESRTTPLLPGIASPADLRKLERRDLPQLTEELRDFLVESVSQTGGHFSSNLGTIELSVALHYVFDTPADRLVWDVGHQCYAHKILTGRRERMNTLRMHDGLSGFPKRIAQGNHAFSNNIENAAIVFEGRLHQSIGRVFFVDKLHQRVVAQKGRDQISSEEFREIIFASRTDDERKTKDREEHLRSIPQKGGYLLFGFDFVSNEMSFRMGVERMAFRNIIGIFGRSSVNRCG